MTTAVGLLLARPKLCLDFSSGDVQYLGYLLPVYLRANNTHSLTIARFKRKIGERQTDRQTETETDRDTDRERETETERETQTDTQTDRQTKTETERDRETERQRDRDRDAFKLHPVQTLFYTTGTEKQNAHYLVLDLLGQFGQGDVPARSVEVVAEL